MGPEALSIQLICRGPVFLLSGVFGAVDCPRKIRMSGSTTVTRLPIAALACSTAPGLQIGTRPVEIGMLVRETNAGRSLVVAERVTNKIVDGPNKERMPVGPETTATYRYCP
jgi:hypothetical protein